MPFIILQKSQDFTSLESQLILSAHRYFELVLPSILLRCFFIYSKLFIYTLFISTVKVTDTQEGFFPLSRMKIMPGEMILWKPHLRVLLPKRKIVEKGSTIFNSIRNLIL